ncbi:hypothetical protein SAMN05428945_0369 [Streptomyces sp. 2224.1]|nr:hypothetical protein SAMN05428945_0369 [Streptomyces sp. 2224.1]
MTATATMAGLDPTTLDDLLRVAGSPGFDRWKDQIRRTGGCSATIHLTGWTIHKDKTTGETLHHYTTADEPGGRLRIACGNRRASRCPACSRTYAGDTYHLIRAGLAGDERRDIPATVRDHPRVFATLTAPSFGPVHNRPDRGACRCGTRHARTLRSWAPRLTRRRTTTRAPCCSITTPGSSGSASPTACVAKLPLAPASPNAS